METQIIVGSSLSGLLLAEYFTSKNIPFIGLEKEDEIGAFASQDLLTISQEKMAESMKELFNFDFKMRSLSTKKRLKSEFQNLENISDQTFYFFEPKDFSNSKNKFLPLKKIKTISPSVKSLICEDGSEFNYANLFWCSKLYNITQVLSDDEKGSLQSFSNKIPTTKLFLKCEFEFLETFFEQNFLSKFVFRFKEYKIEASLFWNKNSLNTYFEIPSDFSEDREEIAKSYKTFKRELLKEFDQPENKIIAEKVSLIPHEPFSNAGTTQSLELMPHIYYFYSELSSTENTLVGFDAVASNFSVIRELLF
jgi:hypothetical protein